MFHNENCRALWYIVSDYRGNKLTKAQAKQRLKQCDLSYVDDLKDVLRTYIYEILAEPKQDVVEVEKTVEVVEDTKNTDDIADAVTDDVTDNNIVSDIDNDTNNNRDNETVDETVSDVVSDTNVNTDTEIHTDSDITVVNTTDSITVSNTDKQVKTNGKSVPKIHKRGKKNKYKSAHKYMNSDSHRAVH